MGGPFDLGGDMLINRRKDTLIAAVLVAPFLAIYLLVFIWPTMQMFGISFTDAPLIGDGNYVGVDNYARLDGDPRFRTAAWNTAYFVLLTVLPGTVVALLIALGVSRLKGRTQAAVLALFFLPYILPVSVVYLIWDWVLNFQFGISMHILDWLGVARVPITKTRDWFMPAMAVVTIWWTAGFSILLFLAGLRAIPAEIYEAAALDNASRWTTFRKITWPLLYPITSLVFTIQLISQLKIFDQVYLFSQGGRPNDNMVLVYYVFQRAFQQDQGGRAAAVAVTLFVLVVAVSVLQFQLLRLSGGRR
jgi:multiple sugar transport system permease protein